MIEGKENPNGLEERFCCFAGVLVADPSQTTLSRLCPCVACPAQPEVDPFAINVPLSLERFKFPIGIYEGAMSKVLVAIDMVSELHA